MAGKKVDPVTGEVDIAEVVTAAVAIPARKGDVISRYLRTETESVDIPTGDVHASIIDEIMAKTTLDDILADDEPEPLSNFVGRVITITGYKANDSEFEEGPPVYFNLSIIDEETGEKRTSNTSEQNVMAQILAIENAALFPFKCRPKYNGRPNKYNRSMIKLGKADD